MLAYFNYGKRRYYENPLPPMQRRFWEFQAVIQGRISKTGHACTSPELKNATLWLSPPGSDHSWTSEANKEATIIVFHYQYIPESLNTIVNHAQNIEVSLSKTDTRQLKRLAEKVKQYWTHPAPGMLLCYEHALLHLSMLTYEAINQQELVLGKAYTSQYVQKALLWYNENMQNSPSLPEVAHAVHSSPANLRRLFHETLQASPKVVFDQLRYQHAMQLLTDTQQPLAAIAQKCGFQDQSAFSRAFKQNFQCSPREIRSTTLRENNDLPKLTH
jgi:AraC-like DNA-binding protein